MAGVPGRGSPTERGMRERVSLLGDQDTPVPTEKPPSPKIALLPDSQPAAHPHPAFPPVTDLYRPIFSTKSKEIRLIGAQNNPPPKHATDFLANVTEKVYRIGQLEAIMDPYGSPPSGREPSDGGSLPWLETILTGVGGPAYPRGQRASAI